MIGYLSSQVFRDGGFIRRICSNSFESVNFALHSSYAFFVTPVNAAHAIVPHTLSLICLATLGQPLD